MDGSDVKHAAAMEYCNNIPRHCTCCGSFETIRLHYGAFTCHGCKAFFRRTISEKKTYSCQKSNNCNTMKEARNSCRACRLQKCLQSGMKPILVREERKAKRQQIESCASGSSQENEESSQLTDDLCALERQVSNAPDVQPSSMAGHWNWYNGVDLLTTIEHPQWRTAKVPMDWRCDRLMQPCDVLNSWQRSTQHFLEWAQQIPEFRQLPPYDQVFLFKKNYQPISWLTRCYKTIETNGECAGITLGNGSYVPLNDIEIGYLHNVYAKLFPSLARKLKALVLDSMRKFELQFEEYCLLKALFLFRKGAQESTFGADICDNATSRILRDLTKFVNRRYAYMNQEERTLRISEFSLFHSQLQYCSVIERNFMNMLPQEDLAYLRGIPEEILKS